MFFGLILNNSQPQPKGVDVRSGQFQISNASLAKGGDKTVYVYAVIGNESFQLCSLQKNKVENHALNLMFQENQKVSFYCKGAQHSVVHLTGFSDIEEQSEKEITTPQSLKKIKNLQPIQVIDVDQEQDDEDDDDDETFSSPDEDEEQQDDEDDDDDETFSSPDEDEEQQEVEVEQSNSNYNKDSSKNEDDEEIDDDEEETEEEEEDTEEEVYQPVDDVKHQKVKNKKSQNNGESNSRRIEEKQQQYNNLNRKRQLAREYENHRTKPQRKKRSIRKLC